ERMHALTERLAEDRQRRALADAKSFSDCGRHHDDILGILKNIKTHGTLLARSYDKAKPIVDIHGAVEYFALESQRRRDLITDLGKRADHGGLSLGKGKNRESDGEDGRPHLGSPLRVKVTARPYQKRLTLVRRFVPRRQTRLLPGFRTGLPHRPAGVLRVQR